MDPRPVDARASHWSLYHRHWERLETPLRVNSEIVAGYAAVIGAATGPVLLQGVTPELADIPARLVAIDRSPAMVRAIWPGDTDRRRAILGNWFNLPFRARSFGGVMGDAGLSILEFPASQARIFDQLGRVLRPGAPVAMRVFRRPERGESVASLREAALAGRVGRFQAFKLRLAMAIVAEGSAPNVAVRRIREVFDREFTERAMLAKVTGWSLDDIATIDAYASSPEVYCFPTERELASVVPPAFVPPRFVGVGTYELAERCPLLVTERRR